MDPLLHATMRRTTSLAAASAMLTMVGPDDKKTDDDTKAIVDAERWEKMLAASTEELRAAASALPQQEVLRLCDENTEGATAPSSSADVDESTVIKRLRLSRALCMRSACLGKLARYAEAARAATASLRAVQLGVPADDARGCMLAKRAQHNVNLSLHKFALAEESKTKTTSARAEAGMKRVRSIGQQMQDSSAARPRAAVAH